VFGARAARERTSMKKRLLRMALMFAVPYAVKKLHARRQRT
jgi:hypothetical protein